VKQSGRQTMGVRLMNLAPGDSVVALARNAESAAEVPENNELGDESNESGDESNDSGDESV